MRWGCPHCGVQLAISDDKLGSGWSFSRCFQCAGYALVRKSEINLIKVDKAPPGEKVILPEATEKPRLGEIATKNLFRTSAPRAPEAPIIRPAAPRGTSLEIGAPISVQQPYPAQAMPEFPDYLPHPLSERPSRVSRIFPVGIAIAAFMAIGSGMYLYIEGQALWQKARKVAETEAIRPAAENTQVASARALGVSEFSDRLQHAAMAPIRDNEPNPRPASPVALLRVRAKSAHAYIFSGPGQDFPVLGTASLDVSYVVTGWNERWFRISSKDLPKGTGWVRNDMVQATTRSAGTGDY